MRRAAVTIGSVQVPTDGTFTDPGRRFGQSRRGARFAANLALLAVLRAQLLRDLMCYHLRLPGTRQGIQSIVHHTIQGAHNDLSSAWNCFLSTWPQRADPFLVKVEQLVLGDIGWPRGGTLVFAVASVLSDEGSRHSLIARHEFLCAMQVTCSRASVSEHGWAVARVLSVAAESWVGHYFKPARVDLIWQV
jgi:hypothetical protein